MVFNVSEGKENDPEEPADPNEVRVALSWLFSSTGTLNYEDSAWTADFDGQDGRLEFRDEESGTTAYVPKGTDGDITGGSSSDTRTDVADDGTTQVTDVEEIDFGTNVSVTDNGDGTVTVEATDTDTDTRVDIEDDGTAVVSDAAQLNATDYLTTADDGAGGATAAVDLPAVVVDHPERPPIAELNDGQSIELPIRVPDGSTLEVYRWGAFDAADGSVPTGLAAELLDGADTVQASEETANTQNKSSPIASHSNSSGSASIFKLRAYNGTGSAINSPGVGCVFGFRVV